MVLVLDTEDVVQTNASRADVAYAQPLSMSEMYALLSRAVGDRELYRSPRLGAFTQFRGKFFRE